MLLPKDLVDTLVECANNDFVGAKAIWSGRLSIATWIVVIGLLLELPELIYDTRDIARQRIDRLKYRVIILEERVQIAKLVAFIGWFLIVGGVYGEVRAGDKLDQLGSNIQTCGDAKVKGATLEAGDAAMSAETANDEADAVKTKADALDIRLEDASRKLSGMEEQIRIQGPRWKLLEDNNDAFIKAMKPFAPQRFTVVGCGQWGKEEVEPHRVEQVLLNLLGKNGAGWAMELPGYAQWTECGSGGGTSSGGNLVTFSSLADKAVKDSAQALSDTLNKLNISTINIPTLVPLRPPPPGFPDFMGPDSPWGLAAKDPTAVIILIGTNPMFDVAGWKKRKK